MHKNSPILDKKYVNAGIKIEPKVVAALKETLKVDIEQFPPEKYNFDYFEDKNKAIGNSLANKTQKITLDAIRAQRDYDKYFYEANIEKWKQSKFYCFVLKTIHDVAKNGESGVIINYLTEKNVMLSTATSQREGYSSNKNNLW